MQNKINVKYLVNGKEKEPTKYLLLGNGFDLHHELPTRYKDMMDIFIFIIEKNKTSFKSVGELLKEYVGNTDQSNDKLKHHYEVHGERLNQISIDFFESILNLKDNCWYNYFRKYYPKDLLWIDFEQKIKEALEIIKFILNETNNQLPINTEACHDMVKDDFFDIFKIANCSSIDEVVDYLSIQLDVFKLAMCDYLKYFVDDVITSNLQSEALEFVKSAFLIINLNYTSTFEKLYAGKGGPYDQKTLYYHGSIENKEKIILGINSNEDDEFSNGKTPDVTFIPFKKYFQRILNNYDDKCLKYIQLKNYLDERYGGNPFYINDDFELIVVGHSLNESDADIIKKLFDKCKSRTIYYHEKTALESYIKNLIKIFGKNEFEKMREEETLTFKELGKYKPVSANTQKT